MVTLLVVEDDEFKADQILEFVKEEWPHLELEVARSVMSGIRILVDKKIDFVVLDMSLPTYDVAPDEPGGRSQAFGGREVLRYLDRMDSKIPVVVVTQYPHFDSGSTRLGLPQIRLLLEQEHVNCFQGLAFFGPGGAWKDVLKVAISRHLETK